MEEKIVETLKAQHQNLKALLLEAKADLEKVEIDPELLLKKLGDFRAALGEHLRLEDEVFYPQLLKKQEEKGMDTEKTREFIGEMKTIAGEVTAFLGNYDQIQKVAEKKDRLRTDLESVIATLLLRVESEEDGVYLYWSL